MHQSLNSIKFDGVTWIDVTIEEFKIQLDGSPDITVFVYIEAKIPHNGYFVAYFNTAPLDTSGVPSFTCAVELDQTKALIKGIENLLYDVHLYGAKKEQDFYWEDSADD